MPAASRISVELVGSSSELQAAAAKAAESLKGLGDVLAKQTDKALVAGDRTIRMNELVARSYQQAARVSTTSSREAAVGFTSSVDKQVSSSQRLIRALEADAAAAQRSAQAQIQANDLAAASATHAADRQVASAKRSEAAFGSSSSALTKTGKTMTLGILGAAAASVYAAVKFQSATTMLQTQAGASAHQVDQLRKGMLAMAQQVGQTPNQLAAGMYHVVSSMNAVLPATSRNVQELKILKIAAEGAAIGHTSLEETSYALASAMNSLHQNAGQAQHTMGELNAIVGAGDMTMTDLLEALKSGLIPTANTFHISLQSVGAALAVMGDMGMRGALAGTRLRMSIALLGAPSEKAAKYLQAIGMSSHEAMAKTDEMSKLLQKAGLRVTTLADDLKRPNGLAVALQDLNRHLIKSGLSANASAALISHAFGGGRSGAAIQLMAQNTDRLQLKFDQIGKTAGSFGHDWQTASHTTAVQLKQVQAGVESLGVRLGTDLLPYVNTGIHDFNALVHWFEQGSTAAHALEIAIGTLATVAIGSYLTSRLIAAIKLMREFGQVVTNPVGAMGRFGAATRPAAAGGVAGALGGGGGMGGIWGARGPIKPGSLMNPLIVAMEAGEFAGLGSMGAAGTVATEQKVAQAESGAAAAAGVRTSAAAGTAAAEAEATALGGGLLATLKTGLGSVLKGAGIAGVGALGAQALGGAIGGSAGKTVSTVGTTASIGAGLGSFLGPTGTLAGGIAGAIAGGFAEFLSADANKYGNELANKLTAPLPKDVARRVHSGLADAANTAHQVSQQAAISPNVTPGPHGRGPSPRGSMFEHPAQLSRDQFQAYFNLGWRAGQATVQGLASVRHPSEYILSRDFRMQLQKLPPQARGEAAKVMLQWASGLESKGQLPKGSVDKVIHSIEGAFPGLQANLQAQGAQTANVIAKAMKMTEAEGNWKSALAQFRIQWGDWSISQNITSQNIVSNTRRAMSDLRTVMATGSRQQRQDATNEYHKLRDEAAATFSRMQADVAAKQGAMTASIIGGSADAVRIAGQNYSGFADAVYSAMSSGLISSQKGADLIGGALNATLKAFGAKGIPLVVLQGQIQATPVHIPTTLGAPGAHAGGGYIGAPGERGRDLVPSVVGRGEAILNHPQQSIANRFLAPIGGLDGLYTATQGTRHWMAAGGFAGGGVAVNRSGAPAPAGPSVALPLPRGSWYSSPSVDQGVDYPAPAGTPEYAMGAGTISSRGISGFGPYAPILSLDSPISGYSTIYYGHAGPGVPVGTHVSAGQAIGSVGAGILGISTGPHLEIGFGPFPGKGNPSAYAMLHLIQGLLSGSVSGAALTGGAAGAVAPIVFKKLSVPKVTGTGTVPDIVRASLTKMTDAANAYGQKQAQAKSSVAGAGSFSGTLSGSVENQVFQFMTAAGFNKIAIAGMLGNAVQESSMNPNAPGGGLWQQISNFGSGTGGSLLHQMQVMLPQIQGLKGSMNAAGSPGNAAVIFEQGFEKAGIPAMANRIAGANAAYAAGYASGGIVHPLAHMASGGIAFRVKASQESTNLASNSGPGCRALDGWSELQNAGSLGGLGCGTDLLVRAGARVLSGKKSDSGGGSSFNPVIGLYPRMSNYLGLSGGEYTVDIQRPDGSRLYPRSGATPIPSFGHLASGGGGGSSHTSSGGIVTMYDATGATLGSIPKGAAAVASYVDNHGGYSQAKGMFPNIPVVSISVNPGNNVAADIYDVEAGGKSVGEAVSAIASGLAGGAYGNAGDLGAVKSGLAGRGVKRSAYKLWVAAWPGSGANVTPGYDAHQYASVNAYDTSAALPSFFSGVAGGSTVTGGSGKSNAPAPPPVLKGKPPKANIPKTPHGSHTKTLSPGKLEALTKANSAVGGLQQRAQDLTGQYSALQGRFAAVEGEPQYLNADGSLNAAGLALHVQDDKRLRQIDGYLKDIYGQELGAIIPALKGALGSRTVDTATIDKDLAKIAANKKLITNLRNEMFLLRKPLRSGIPAIQAQLKALAKTRALTRAGFEKQKAALGTAATPAQRRQLVKLRAELAAVPRGKSYEGKRRALRAQIATITGQISTTGAGQSSARSAINQAEQAALYDLDYEKFNLADALDAEYSRERDKKFSLKTKLYGLQGKVNRLTQDDATISGEITAVRGVLHGDDQNLVTLEQIAATLGQVEWDKAGNFVGIDTSSQGLAFTTMTDMISIENDIAKTLGLSAAAPVDNSALLSLLQQQNLVLSETVALNEAQTRALASMIPQIPHYDQGGPVLHDSLAMVHQGEHVVPRDGALVIRDGGGGAAPEVHVHVHGDASGLIKLVRSEVRHPNNVREISRQIGVRTSQLAGAPGGFR